MFWFGWLLWHINHCNLFNAKFSLYIYIKYIWFGWVGISTVVGYLMLNPLYSYQQFYFKQFSFTLLQSLNIKNGSISNYSVYQQS